MVSYGVHLDKAWLCTVASIGCYLLGLVFARRVVLPYPVTLALLGLGLVSFLRYAPAETKKRPLSEKLKKHLKPLAISNYVVIATLCAIARTPVISNLILWAIIIQSFNITPLSFKLFTWGGKQC